MNDRKTNESQHSAAVKYLVLLKQGLLPEMRELSDFFTFQQDSAPAHRARPSVELLEKEVPVSFLRLCGRRTARI